MTFQEMLEKRESCRAYADRPVSREDLMELIEAGRLSPSGCNAQPWKFIVVDEPEACVGQKQAGEGDERRHKLQPAPVEIIEYIYCHDSGYQEHDEEFHSVMGED